jgi:hypothetical protein
VKAAAGAPSTSAIDYLWIPASPAPRAPVPYPVGAEETLAAVAEASIIRVDVSAEELEVHFGGLGGSASDSLEELGDTGSHLAQELEEAASGDLAGLADLVGGELADDLGSATSLYLDGAAPPLADRLAGLADVMAGGADVMDVAAALSPPIQWARGIVETIGNLLEAMRLGL